MRSKIYILFLFTALLSGIVRPAGAQLKPLPTDTTRTRTDTARKIFSLTDFQRLVLRNHPIVKQAFLLSDEARAKLTQAWGGFDPLLSSDWDKKDFGNTLYYNYWHSELKVPLWLAGADLKVAYDRTVGTYINPDKRTANNGLSSVGLSVPIGQGLLIDARRNTLKQARLMVDYAEADKIKQINEVWFNAIKEYWDWYYAFAYYKLIEDGVGLAQQRFRAISLQAAIGDKPPIDSVEASITVYDRRIQFEKIRIELQNSKLILSNYLWNEDDQPLELPDDAAPQDGSRTIGATPGARIDSLLSVASNQHPDVIKLRSRIGQLAIEGRYRRQLLRPKLNVSGYLLSNRTFFEKDVADPYNFQPSNYKFGVDFSFPLFLRSERGRLRQVYIQQRQLNLDLTQTGREIRNDIATAYNSLKAYEAQLSLQTQSISAQQILLNGELQKFELGESTLFVINSRETKLIEMRIKREEMIADYQKKLAELYYKAGTRQMEGL